MRMDICVAVNKKYIRYLYVMLLSLFENNYKDDVSVYIMNRNLEEQNCCALRELAEKFKNTLHFISVDESAYSNLMTTEQYSVETYFRLDIANLVPSDIDRILYLDVDIIVQGSLQELFNIPMDGMYFMACQDIVADELPVVERSLFGRFEDLRYFNAGVMMWNLKELRRDGIGFYEYMKIAEKFNYCLPLNDQDILNYGYYDKTIFLNPLIYNYMTNIFLREEWSEEKTKEAIILHFSGYNPWKAGPKAAICKKWWNYAKKTPFYQEMLEEQIDCLEKYIYDKDRWGLSKVPKEQMLEFNQNILVKCIISSSFPYRIPEEKVCLYGAGRMASLFYCALKSNRNAGIEIEAVIDKNAAVTFFDVPVYHDLSWMNSMTRYLLIITPIDGIEEIRTILRDKVGENNKIMTMQEFFLKYNI